MQEIALNTAKRFDFKNSVAVFTAGELDEFAAMFGAGTDGVGCNVESPSRMSRER